MMVGDGSPTTATREGAMTYLIHLRHLALGAIRDPHWVGATTGHA